MKKYQWFCLLLASVFLCVSPAFAAFDFEDTRFQGVFTTENLDRIIKEYELNDGWYWTTRPYVTQTFQGVEDAPGWTDTAVNVYKRPYYKAGVYGCRWGCNAGGVRVGDIVRTEFTAVVKGKEKKYYHSAVVYSVSEDEILFLQISGSLYNKIILGEGFADGYHEYLTTLEGLAKLPNIRICRSPLNHDPEETAVP